MTLARAKCTGTAMKHLDVVEIAKLLSEDPGACRHIAEACGTCGERLQQVEALMQRFEHWDPEVVVLEGLPAEGLFAAILAAGEDFTHWSAQVDENEELQTWGVAWVALEQARKQISEEASPSRAGDLALLAAKIAESLGDAYHPDSVADLKARAYAAAAAAVPADSNLIETRLKRMAKALAALEKGTGDKAVALDIWHFLSQGLRRADGDTSC